MVTITQGQRVADYPQFIVISPSGDYKEEDLIICAEDDVPGKPYCMFQAQLVVYGNIVYSSSDPITEAQKAEIAAEQARIAEENPPDQGNIIEVETSVPVEASALGTEEPAPAMEIITEVEPAAQNMSTTTPATTTDAVPPTENTASSTPAAPAPIDTPEIQE